MKCMADNIDGRHVQKNDVSLIDAILGMNININGKYTGLSTNYEEINAV